MAGAVLGVCALLLTGGASCTKESKESSSDPAGVVKAADAAKGGAGGATGAGGAGAGTAEPTEIDRTPLPGVDVSKLEGKRADLFYKLVGSYSSPCGKAHSLRTSVTTDQACKKAPFAARYLAAMIEDEIPEEDIRTLYDAKYKKEPKQVTFALGDGVPHEGPIDAPIQIVEFFDYGCPACQDFKPVMDEVIAQNGSTVVVYYKQFPLTDKHPDSMSAAQAALAASAQGRYKEMHDLLFANAPRHRRADVLKYAKELGLDIMKFEADYADAEKKVRADIKEGDAAGVRGTPSIFFNGRQYEGPAHPRYFAFWIQEELAVNR